MRKKDQIRLAAVLLAVSVWVIDATIDHALFYDYGFWQILLTGVPTSELFIRSFLSICILIFGFIISRFVALRESSEESLAVFKYALDTSGSEIYIHDLDTLQLLYVNEGAVNNLGYSEKQLLEMTPLEIAPDLTVAKFRRFVKPLIDGQVKGLSRETHHRRKDGSIYPVEIHLTHIRYREHNCLLAIIIDITERKKIEEEREVQRVYFENLFEYAPEAIIILDNQNRILQCNREFENLFGYTREEAVGRAIIDLIVPQDLKAEGMRFTREVATGEEINMETVCISKEGNRIEVAITGKPILLGENRLGVYGIYRDITDKKRLEAEVQKSQKMESIGILAGGLAHDFNNRLSIILGNAQLAHLKYGQKEDISDYLQQIEDGALKATSLTQQLLAFSKGGTTIKKSVSIAEIIRKSVSFALSGSNISPEYHLPEQLWPVAVDIGQMEQVINNLIINAKQAMPAGGLIRIAAQNLVLEQNPTLPLKDGHYVRIDIQDNGIGIPKQYIHKVFDPYFTTKSRGSGLGLTSVYSIIKNHDGYITLESQIGQGTTVHLYLSATDNLDQSADTETQGMRHGQGRILIMDDEEQVRDVLASMLTTLGYTCRVTKDGQEALDCYRKARKSDSPFRAVIMDLTIPGAMGGREAMQRLLEIDPQVKSIVASGYSHDTVMANYQAYGFSGVIRKPFKIEELSQTLYQVLDSPQSKHKENKHEQTADNERQIQRPHSRGQADR